MVVLIVKISVLVKGNGGNKPNFRREGNGYQYWSNRHDNTNQGESNSKDSSNSKQDVDSSSLNDEGEVKSKRDFDRVRRCYTCNDSSRFARDCPQNAKSSGSVSLCM